MNAILVQEFIFRLTEFLPVIASIAAALLTVLGAFRSGILRKIRVGGIEVEGVDQPTLERIRAEIVSARGTGQIPFEIEQLTNYYSLSLGQARVSFWFILVFASIGFLVIIGAAIFYQGGDYIASSIKIVSGIIIDAVAALFFVQSSRARESMASFFEKLRIDRQFVEARKICEEIQNPSIKDNLKTILVLHYSGIQSDPMMTDLSAAAQKPETMTAPSLEVERAVI